MLPCSTYVLDHTLELAPDDLFNIVKGFVRPLLSDPMKPLSEGAYNAMHFTLTGVEWDAERKAIKVIAQLCVPRQEDHWRLQEADTYEIIYTPTIKLDNVSSMALAQVEVTTLSEETGDEKLTARIRARPGTEAEQLAIQLAAYIVRETACTAYKHHTELAEAREAAYEKWREWLEAKIKPLMSEKRDRELGFSVECQRTLCSLNTDIDHFVDQLRDLTNPIPAERFTTEKGYISLSPTPLTYHYQPGQPPVLYMWGLHHTVKNGVETVSHLGPLILFKIITPSDGRIGVVATCLHPAVERYFEGLVEKINRQYPKAREAGEPTGAELAARVRAILEAIDRLNSQQVPTEPPPTRKNTGRKSGKNTETATKVAKARLIMELKNKGQTVACDQVPVSPTTLRKWRNDPDILSEMEQLRQDSDFLKDLETS